MDGFVKAIEVAELPPGRGVEVHLGERQIALFNTGGEFFAVDSACPHQGGPLADGYLECTNLVCPWHAWTFDLKTGVSPDDPESKVTRYDVKVESGQVFVRLESIR